MRLVRDIAGRDCWKRLLGEIACEIARSDCKSDIAPIDVKEGLLKEIAQEIPESDCSE